MPQKKDNNVYLTNEGLEKIKEELNLLKTVRKKEIAKRLNKSLEYGDLSENTEYQEAKEELSMTEARIYELEDMLKRVSIIDSKKSKTKTVRMGSMVKIEELEEGGEIKQFKIVGTMESNPLNTTNPTISNISPVGNALLNHQINDIVEFNSPAGILKVKILDIQ